MIHPCRKEKIIQRVLAILSFHKIGAPGPGGWNSWVYTPVLEAALPWLRRFGYPAVSFVSTGYIGGLSTFDSGIEPEEPICDWEDLRELQRQGISIQSHGVTHRGFSLMGPVEQEEELLRSKVVLETHLGRRGEEFAFPYV